jgi:hypothetical protein
MQAINKQSEVKVFKRGTHRGAIELQRAAVDSDPTRSNAAATSFLHPTPCEETRSSQRAQPQSPGPVSVPASEGFHVKRGHASPK